MHAIFCREITKHTVIYVGLARTDICTVYDRMHGGFPAKNTVCTPYIPIYVRFWPTLVVSEVLILSERSMAYPITDF